MLLKPKILDDKNVTPPMRVSKFRVFYFLVGLHVIVSSRDQFCIHSIQVDSQLYNNQP